MIWYQIEPTLTNLLADPLIRAVMDADGVDRHELEAVLRQASYRLGVPSDEPDVSGWIA
jgi:hypothetical protein